MNLVYKTNFNFIDEYNYRNKNKYDINNIDTKILYSLITYYRINVLKIIVILIK